MKVCYIYQDEFPWDVRADKIMNGLADAGIEGHIISRNRSELPQIEKLKDRLFVHRLPAVSNRAINDLINFPAFFSPLWLNLILSVIRSAAIDLVIVRDLPLSPAALLAGRVASKPVLMDMAENYPAMIEDTWRYRGPDLMDYVFRNPLLLRRLERMVLRKMDGVIAVSNQSRDRVLKFGVRPDAVWVVGNTPRIDIGLNPSQKLPKNDIRNSSSYIIVYVGGLEEGRGLEIVVRALPEVKREIPDVLLVVAGAGSSEYRLKSLANLLGVSAQVRFLGWVEPTDVPCLIRSSDVGIVPHFVTEHTDTTVPNKIFDYMAQKKPVIVTNSRSLTDIVHTWRCGKIYRDDDPSDLRRVILQLANPEVREKQAEQVLVPLSANSIGK